MKTGCFKNCIASLVCLGAMGLLPRVAHAVSSAELYTGQSYAFGRVEARIQFAPGDGVVSSFFMWKDGSELDTVFWNELDFEKLRAGCELETNALYGMPESSHNQSHADVGDLCGTFRTYAYEWTPEYIAWFIDGVEIRRETGEVATAYAENAAEGMQIRFNVWPGDSSFGGDFDPAILPVHEYINWVQYSSYVDGAFQLQWREDFNAATVPSGWSTGSWGSPKGLSTHTAANITFMNGYAVLSLTADDATGGAGAAPLDPEDSVAVPPVEPTPEVMPSVSVPVDTAPPVASMAATDSSASDASDEGGCSYRALKADATTWRWSVCALGLVYLARRRRVRSS